MKYYFLLIGIIEIIGIIPNLYCAELEMSSYNQLKYTKLYLEGNNAKESDSFDFDKISYNVVSHVSYENLKVVEDVEFYSMSAAPTEQKNVSLAYSKKNDMQINALYAKLELDDISIFVGNIPFKGGKFEEIKTPYTNGGNGLPILVNQVFTSAFVSYKPNDELSIIAGHATWEKESNYNSLQEKNDGSDGNFYLVKYANGRNYLELNYFDVNVMMNGFKYSDLQLFGLGYIFNDSTNSGFTGYCNVAKSIDKENVSEYIDTTKYKPIKKFLPYAGFEIKDQSNNGEALLLGLKYDGASRIFGKNRDWYIGSEYFKTYGGYVSMAHGTLFLGDHTWWGNRQGQEIIVHGGIQVNKHFLVNAKYSRTSSEYVSKGFSISSVTTPDKIANGYSDYYTVFEKIEVNLNYRF